MPREQESRWLSVMLWLGGVPPVLSGLLAATVPGWYLALTGVPDALAPAGSQAAAFLWHLQGGDAFIAGTARIAVAALGTLALKRILGALMILHSAYELWLIPTHAFTWCERNAGVCTELYRLELWAFLALHVVLVVGAVAVLGRGLAGSREPVCTS